MNTTHYAAPRCPASLKEGFTTYCPAAQRKIFNGKRVFHVLREYNEHDFWVNAVNEKNQETSDYLITKLDLIKNKLLPSEKGGYLLKTTNNSSLTNKRFFLDLPANEHLCLQIAHQILKIETIPNALMFFPDGKPAIIYRFQQPMATFRSFHDFYNSDYKTNHDEEQGLSTYLDAMKIIEKNVSAMMVMKERFFRQILFSWLVNDTNHHFINSGLVRSDRGDYVLAPLTGLVSNGLHELGPELSASNGLYPGDKSSREFMEYGYYTYYDFVEFGLKSGISKARTDIILKSMTDNKNQISGLIDSAFLPDEAKNTLKFNFSKRFSRIS